MSTQALAQSSSRDRQRLGYRTAGLTNLFEQVAWQADRDALDEFLERRRIFVGTRGKKELLPEYLYQTWGQWRGHGGQAATELLDDTYNRTIDKFSLLPVGDAGVTRRETGPDCRKYYRAFLRSLPAFISRLPDIDSDHRVAQCFQRFVNRHFIFSLLEAQRHCRYPLVSRYEWRIGDNGSIWVWMPKYMDAGRRTWLEENVDNPDPHRLGERERVQSIVDKRLVMPYLSRLPDSGWGTLKDAQWDFRTRLDANASESPLDFVEVVALEKSLSWDSQRPAIRQLGPKGVYQLVWGVFENLKTGELTDSVMAERHGLSHPAYSRFAGRNWQKRKRRDGIPDLYRNAAECLSRIPAFVKTARAAGLVDPIEAAEKNGAGKETFHG